MFRKLPTYFLQELDFPARTFFSPNFIRTANKKGIRIFSSLIVNLSLFPLYLFEIFRLGIQILHDQPGIIVNHYDPVGALSVRIFGMKKRQILVSHHFYLSHPDFIHPHGMEKDYFWLQWMNHLIQKNANTILAISFRKGNQYRNIRVVPPLVDTRILQGKYSPGSRDLCYFLNEGFLDELLQYYASHPQMEADIFSELPTGKEVPSNVQIHAFSRQHFIQLMLQCKRMITTAGFDIAAEAFFHGIPLYVIPSEHHYEQYCNALDAADTGMAYQMNSLSELQEAELEPLSNRKYRKWLLDEDWLTYLDIDSHIIN